MSDATDALEIRIADLKHMETMLREKRQTLETELRVYLYREKMTQ